MTFSYQTPSHWGKAKANHWDDALFVWLIGTISKNIYSQCGQDIFIIQLADYLNYKDRTFIDLGANTGLEGSTTFLLERKGWIGILVEPNLNLAGGLAKTRTSQTISAAVGEQRGIQKFITSDKAHQLGTISKENKYQTQRLVQETASQDGNILESYVPVVQLRDIFEAYTSYTNKKPLTLLKIDIEGGEHDVVKQLEAMKERPLIIEIENNLRENKTGELLEKMGYHCLVVMDSFVEIWCERKISKKEVAKLVYKSTLTIDN